MTKYKHIAELGLGVTEVRSFHGGGDYVKADDLEALLASAMRVYSIPENEYEGWTAIKRKADTHQALLIGIKPIERPDPLQEFVDELIDTIGSLQSEIDSEYESSERQAERYSESRKATKESLEQRARALLAAKAGGGK